MPIAVVLVVIGRAPCGEQRRSEQSGQQQSMKGTHHGDLPGQPHSIPKSALRRHFTPRQSTTRISLASLGLDTVVRPTLVPGGCKRNPTGENRPIVLKKVDLMKKPGKT